MTNKFKELSRNFKELGNMDPSYKGFALFSTVSQEFKKAVLSIHLDQISLLILDYDNCKISWINKDNYKENGKVLIYVEKNNVLLCAKKDSIHNVLIIYTINKYNDVELIDFIKQFNMFEEDIIINLIYLGINDEFFYMLKYYLIENENIRISQSEKLRYRCGKIIYDYLIAYNITPHEMVLEYNKNVKKYSKRITYILC